MCSFVKGTQREKAATEFAFCFSEQVSQGEKAFLCAQFILGKHWGSEVERTRIKILVPDEVGAGNQILSQ